ncbi:uncharacterized protein [Procambarus clarkii]|uniref:uncharacterized protein n=1 Tax=Procambarus clarkii TaxID=6728 RepID=UPI001E6724CA|nr:uncharacterized protein LOC123766107 [Procambarus clarkii]
MLSSGVRAVVAHCTVERCWHNIFSICYRTNVGKMCPSATLTMLLVALSSLQLGTVQGYIIGTSNATQTSTLPPTATLATILGVARTIPIKTKGPEGNLLDLGSLLKGANTPRVAVLGDSSFPASSTTSAPEQSVGSGPAPQSGPQVTVGDTAGSPPYAGGRYSSPRVVRVDSPYVPTVTQFVTIDRCITVTDQAFNSVPVTLTSLNVHTVTAGTRAILQTPVDDRVALQTVLVYKPTSLTVTSVKSDFRIVTEVSLDRVTLAHTSYVIVQSTFTTTATQVVTLSTTLVRTNISTQRTTLTDYRTLTDTVYVNSGYGYRTQ